MSLRDGAACLLAAYEAVIGLPRAMKTLIEAIDASRDVAVEVAKANDRAAALDSMIGER